MDTATDSWRKSVTVQEITDEQKWTFASEVTEYSPYGAELENRDALTSSRFSSAQHGYNYTLPTAVASNSRYKHMGADNFEDYNFRNSIDGHFNFKTTVDEDGPEGAKISSARSHTGKNSLVLRQGDEAYLFRELLGEAETFPDRDGDGIMDAVDICPDTPLEEGQAYHPDRNFNGIGDDCEDGIFPVISEEKQSGQYRCRTKQVEFYITGQPNETVEMRIRTLEEGPEGWSRVYINGERIDKTGKFMRYSNIELDETGRKLMQLEFVAKRRRRGNRNNIEIEIAMSQNVGGPLIVSADESDRITIKMFGGLCTSGNDKGAKAIF